MDPLRGTPWSEAGTVAGFARSDPNQTLLRFAADELATGKTTLLDIGCAPRATPFRLRARAGW